MKKTVILLITLSSFSFALSAIDMVSQYGCLECHAIYKDKTAPSYLRISKRNKKLYGKDGKIHIQNSIKNGSQGKYQKFKQNIMPQYDYFTKSELDLISNWILSLQNEK